MVSSLFATASSICVVMNEVGVKNLTDVDRNVVLAQAFVQDHKNG